MTAKKTLSETPLYICLSGDLYADKNKAMVGTIVTEDTRLTALDAFLDSLSDASELQKSKGDYSLSDALRLMVRKCPPTILENHDVVLEVTSSLDLQKHEMTHVFRIRAEKK